MKRALWFVTACGCLLLCVVTKEAWGQSQNCAVKIAAPKDGDAVAEMDDVTGTGTIPEGSYLWIFAHRRGLALWWPEGGGAATITQGKWIVAATFGQERDNGRQFEIAAAVLDRNTNEKLVSWVKKTAETGQYPGMDFPSTVEGCKVEKVTVTKGK